MKSHNEVPKNSLAKVQVTVYRWRKQLARCTICSGSLYGMFSSCKCGSMSGIKYTLTAEELKEIPKKYWTKEKVRRKIRNGKIKYRGNSLPVRYRKKEGFVAHEVLYCLL